MNRLQFRVLYREFLFRMIDLEVLSSQGDIKDLLGQFGSILVYFSALEALGVMFFDPRKMPPRAAVGIIWGTEHFLISTTMLVMGLFAVLSWDSTFLDRRDVLVLAPLPVAPRTLFLAKAAALGAALGLTTAAINTLPGITWGLLVFPAPNSGLPGPFRALAAYWIAALAGASFVFCSVLAVQGMAGQLPRRWYLRLSPVLQIIVFCLILGTYFLQPGLSNPWAFAAPQNQHALACLPSYWFLGLFHFLNGAATPGVGAAAARGALGLAAAVAVAGTAYLLAYVRSLRKIVEEPDIVPGGHGGIWLPRFGNSFHTAIVRFSIRTLVRSRQHRLILAFYLGIGFSLLILLGEALQSEARRNHTVAIQANVPLLLAGVLMLAVWVLGTRALFGLPLELRANWIFRVIPLPGPAECLKAGRRALLALSVAPLCAIAAVAYVCIWPWRQAAEHVAVLALLGAFLCEVCLQKFQKLPFTCSYLPGRSRVHMALMCLWPLLAWSAMGVQWELGAFDHPARYAQMTGILAAAAMAARWSASHLAKSDQADVYFEETIPTVVQTLGLRFEPTEHPASKPA